MCHVPCASQTLAFPIALFSAGLVADIASTIRQAVPGADTANLAALLEAQATGTDRVELAILSSGQQQTEVLRTLLVELRRLTAQNEALLRRVA